MTFNHLVKHAAEVIRDDCLRHGWITAEDELRILSCENPAMNQCELRIERVRDGLILAVLTGDYNGKSLHCTYHHNLRKPGDTDRPMRPKSRLAAHEARWT